MKTHLDLFSGIGGFALAAKWAGFETVAFCEIEEYPRKVLEKNFPGVAIHRDVREIDGNDYRNTTLITGGYPCQPFSLAGQRGGEEDDRHLWPEMFRIIKQARPTWVVAENVAGHITMGLDQVLSELESEGYAARPVVIPACAVDAPHRRDRVWIIANAERITTDKSIESEMFWRWEKETEQTRVVRGRGFDANPIGIDDDGSRYGAGSICRERSGQAELRGSEEDVSNSGCRNGERPRREKRTGKEQAGWISQCGLGRENDGLSYGLDRFDPGWSTGEWEAGIPRVATGIPNRVDRLKGLGNAIVPQVAYQILRLL